MKARRFIKRDRTTDGRGTGTLLCRLSLPVTGEEYDWRNNPVKRARAVGLMRKFVERHLPENPQLLIGAVFVIEAEIRAKSGRIARRRLAIWQFGEALLSTFETASHEWASMEFEEDWTIREIDF